MTHISVEEMQKNASAAEKLLKSLANSHRLMVLCHLVQGESTVGELEAKLDISQSSLSQHLAKLRSQGIVGYRKEGTTVFYRIEDKKALAVLDSLYGIFCKP
ncbi:MULTISPECIES: metalloregulator ArsR/SmtB family transcription factor [Gammaproteobacteria]|uniref:ArsR/SmtB family transcription factor n=1 Tax=Gammaproteobacteria TaxID=1236 RepID=UPI001A9F3803|nr:MULTISPECIES: metalloregulator ArsR/SmtB family transcription factor [Gammaproteobacteria]